MLLGSNSGTIVKFNSNKGFLKKHQFWNIFDIKHSAVISKKDAENNPIEVEKGREDILTTSKKHIFREFFVGHKTKVVYIDFL